MKGYKAAQKLGFGRRIKRVERIKRDEQDEQDERFPKKRNEKALKQKGRKPAAQLPLLQKVRSRIDRLDLSLVYLQGVIDFAYRVVDSLQLFRMLNSFTEKLSATPLWLRATVHPKCFVYVPLRNPFREARCCRCRRVFCCAPLL